MSTRQLASQRRQRDKVLEFQRQATTRKMFKPRCLNGVDTARGYRHNVITNKQQFFWPENMVRLLRSVVACPTAQLWDFLNHWLDLWLMTHSTFNIMRILRVKFRNFRLKAKTNNFSPCIFTSEAAAGIRCPASSSFSTR